MENEICRTTTLEVPGYWKKSEFWKNRYFLFVTLITPIEHCIAYVEMGDDGMWYGSLCDDSGDNDVPNDLSGKYHNEEQAMESISREIVAMAKRKKLFWRILPETNGGKQ